MAVYPPYNPWRVEAPEAVPGAAPVGTQQQQSVDSLSAPMQALSMNEAAQAQSMAAMMWQTQYQAAMMMPPWPPPGAAMMSSLLHVKVEGLRFEYQLTNDDVRKVFSRYGDVLAVQVEADGTSATVQFGQPHHAVAAQHDLDRKQLSGMSDAHLRVEFAPQTFDPNLAQLAGAAQGYVAPPMFPQMPGYPVMPQQMAPQGGVPMPTSPARKHTCKLEVGIENDNEFRVGSRAVQIARQIWQKPRFQETGGKTRLRGKGAGGAQEANEPLALCISCQDDAVFEEAVQYAEAQLQKVHNDYKAFCEEKGLAVPELTLKVSKKSAGSERRFDQSRNTGADQPRGERSANAPADEEIEKLIEERNEARKVANFKRSDEIRDYLKACGVVLMDEKGAKGNLKGNDVTKWRFWRP